MRLQSRLNEWQKQQFLSPQQVHDITVFEKNRLRDLFQTGLKYTALFAILLGISLIVAANWDEFGVATRLVAHMGVNAFLAFLIWRWTDNPARRGYRETAVYALSGLTLTLLALIGQSFQLQGDIGSLLILWLALITGLIIMAGDHERIARFWFLGFIVTFFVGGNYIAEQMTEPYGLYFIISLVTLLPLALWCDGHIRKLREVNRPFADMLVDASFIFAVVSGFAASLLYYRGLYFLNELYTNEFFAFLTILASVTLVGFVVANRIFKNRNDLLILALGAVSFLVPFVFPIVMGDGSFMATVHFIILALALGFVAMCGGHYRLMNLCIIALSARLFIAFLELFGTMLMTGWGMILAGVILFGILRLTRMAQRYLTQQNKAEVDHA